MAQVVQHLPSKPEVLSSNPRTVPTKKPNQGCGWSLASISHVSVSANTAGINMAVLVLLDLMFSQERCEIKTKAAGPVLLLGIGCHRFGAS
jgi:hypothetical protein